MLIGSDFYTLFLIHFQNISFVCYSSNLSSYFHFRIWYSSVLFTLFWVHSSVRYDLMCIIDLYSSRFQIKLKDSDKAWPVKLIMLSVRSPYPLRQVSTSHFFNKTWPKNYTILSSTIILNPFFTLICLRIDWMAFSASCNF